MKHLSLFILAAVTPCAAAAADDLAASLVGTYYSVEEDFMYGPYEQDCEIKLDKDGNLNLVDFPVVGGNPVIGTACEEDNTLRFENGQVLSVNSYGDKYYFWSAAPDDPETNYTIDIDKEIVFKYNPETGALSWRAPYDDENQAWLRFMMVGGEYFDYNANMYKYSGMYHFTEATLYPVNSKFEASRVYNEIWEDVYESVNAIVNDNKLYIYGLMHLDHNMAIEFALNPTDNSLTLLENKVKNDEEYGEIFVYPLKDESVEANAIVDNNQTEITLSNIKIEDKTGEVTNGDYYNCKLIIPFDIFAGVEQSGLQSIANSDSTEVTYFNLQGIRVNNPTQGIYICRTGTESRLVRL